MAEKAEIILRKARREDMIGVIKLAQGHGWNKLLEHLYLIFDLFPDGFYIAESTEGEILSHCAALPLDEANGFIAWYITKENWRGKGIGRKVFDMSYKALGKRNFGLNADKDLQAMYASAGFKISTAWFQPYQCQINQLKNDSTDIIAELQGTPKLIQIKTVSMDRILAYDNKIHTIKREGILRGYLNFAHVGLAAVDEDGKLVGWGLIYRGCKAYCLMPLYADTPHIARILLISLLQNVQGEKDDVVEVVYPVENAEAGAMFEEFGFSAGGNYLRRRMFTECDVPFKKDLVFSLLNLDTGII